MVGSTWACYGRQPLERGPTVQLSPSDRDGEALIGVALELLAAGDDARAFHAVEYEKSRRIAGALAVDDAPNPAREVSDVSADFEIADVDADGRGVRLEVVADPAGQAEDEGRFWQSQALMEARIATARQAELPYARLVGTRYHVATAAEVARNLGGDEALVSYLVARNHLHAFVTTRQGVRAVELADDAASVERDIARLLADLRAGDGDAWRRSGAKVAARILTPLVGSFAPDTRRLRIVPDALTARIPFGALPLAGPDADHDAPLAIERYLITYLPTASFLGPILAKPAVLYFVPRVLAVGDPAAPAPWPRLPAAEIEARTVARIFSGSIALVGDEAREERIYDLYPDFDVLHFATHGALSGRSSTSALVLASTRAPWRPEHDGYVTANEIRRMDLRHCHLVVLSACDTSVSRDGLGGSSLGSVTGAFLTAGASTVIGSLWQVADEATAHLMLELYTHIAEDGPSEALRRAQLAIRRQAKWEHPYYWGAFVPFGLE